MLKSCKYCGRVHDEHFDCGMKKDIRREKKRTDAKKFRSSSTWTKLRAKIVERDQFCCCVCRDINGDTRRNYENIEVHHIVPIVANDDLKEDEDNLITLCRYHHEEAEKGALTKEYLRGLIK